MKSLRTYWNKENRDFLPSYAWSNGKNYLLRKGHFILSSKPTREDRSFSMHFVALAMVTLCCQQIAWVWPLFPYFCSFFSASLPLLRGCQQNFKDCAQTLAVSLQLSNTFTHCVRGGKRYYTFLSTWRIMQI